MPAGELTVPEPVPAIDTLNCTGTAAKLAVTDIAAVGETVHVVAAPLHAPLQPVKPEPGAATAVRLTAAP